MDDFYNDDYYAGDDQYADDTAVVVGDDFATSDDELDEEVLGDFADLDGLHVVDEDGKDEVVATDDTYDSSDDEE